MEKNGCSISKISRSHQVKSLTLVSCKSRRTLKGKKLETYVTTFTINIPFEEWSKAYDSSIDDQKEAGITSIYRGFLKNDPTQVCSIMEAEAGQLDAFMAENAKMFAASGHALESSVISTYKPEWIDTRSSAEETL